MVVKNKSSTIKQIVVGAVIGVSLATASLGGTPSWIVNNCKFDTLRSYFSTAKDPYKKISLSKLVAPKKADPYEFEMIPIEMYESDARIQYRSGLSLSPSKKNNLELFVIGKKGSVLCHFEGVSSFTPVYEEVDTLLVPDQIQLSPNAEVYRGPVKVKGIFFNNCYDAEYSIQACSLELMIDKNTPKVFKLR